MEKERGRPLKPEAERRTILFPIRVNAAELEAIRKAAGNKPSTWARELLLKAAKRKG
jgi:ribosomal protein L15E